MDKKQRPPTRKPLLAAIVIAAVAAIAILVAACAVLSARSATEQRIKLRYDGQTYLGQDTGAKHYPSYGGSIVDSFGTSGIGGEKAYDSMDTAGMGYDAPAMAEGSSMPSGIASSAQAPSGDAGAPSGQSPAHGKKLAYSYDYSIESQEFDRFVEALEDALASSGGFVERSTVDRKEYDSVDETARRTVRKATYALRVPADSVDGLRAMLDGELSELVYENVRMSDRTQAYVDAEAQLESYRTEYAALESLLPQAGSVSELIEIQDRLSWLNYQIESARKSMEIIDEDVAYSYVYLDAYEVIYYTATVYKYVFDFGEHLADTFEDFVYRLPDFVVILIYVFVTGLVIVGLAAMLASVVLAMRDRKRQEQVIRVVQSGTPSPDRDGGRDPGGEAET